MSGRLTGLITDYLYSINNSFMGGKNLIIASFFLLWGNYSFAQQQNSNSSNNNGVERPKLVIGLVVDQMRWDYLYRYFNRYGEGGFKRLLSKGYSYENTFIPYASTSTSPGHSCLYTGTVPAIHGIVENDWIERSTGKHMYCTQDDSVQTVGSYSAMGKMSPKNLLVSTIGDELRLASNFKSRVYGIAIKDRGGIVTAGHSANGAYWFDDSTGNWISSTYYMKELPQWVNTYNGMHKADVMMREDWNLLHDRSLYDQSTDDNKGYERTLIQETTTTFPHSYKTLIGKRNYLGFRSSPYGNTFSFDFAQSLIEHERLGSTGQTDMLCLSLSSTDYVAHKFGPNSLEMEDVYLRLDSDLENFLNFLDKYIGEHNYLFFLSADHGAPQVPAFVKEHQFDAGNLRLADLQDTLNQVCFKKFGVTALVKKVYEYEVYLDHHRIDSLHMDEAAIKEFLVSYLLSKPEVVHAFDYQKLEGLLMPEAEKKMFVNGYFRNRSGDIHVVLKPQFFVGPEKGTEHGTWYTYDTHIPLVWYGWKVGHGQSYRKVYMTDVAPTIAAMLKIQVPNGSIGNVLEEMLK